MAAAPPPYTGPSAGPNYDPRRQRRMQKEQLRAQRAYYRNLRRPSLVRPILLIAIGVVALLIQTGTLSGYTFLDWYVRWWPLVLIAVGLLLLGEWYIQRDRPHAGGFLGLLILLPLLGAIARHAANSPFGWHFAPDDDWSLHMFGEEHDADKQFDQAFGNNGRLTISNPRGDLSIAVSADDRIHVSARESVFTSSEKDATQQLTRLDPALRVNGNDATLTTASLDRGSVDLTIQVPAATSLSITAGRGNVAVNGLAGTVAVDASHGDVTLNKLGGQCTARLSGGNFAAHALAGSINLSGRTEDADISDVSGKVTLEGDFLGDVSLAQIHAPLSFHSSKTEFELDRLDGDLSLNHEDLTLRRAVGKVHAVAKAKNINLSNLAGPLSVETADGDISVELTGGDGPIELRNRNGAIRLGLPPDHLFHVDARTHDGSVNSSLTYAGKVEKREKSLTGDTGAGTGPATPVTLVTEHGDIEIRPTEAQPLSAPPEPPAAPAAPRPPHAPRPPRLQVPREGPAPETSEQ